MSGVIDINLPSRTIKKDNHRIVLKLGSNVTLRRKLFW